MITGAGSGIGQATAEKFAREGARLALADLNFEKVARVAEEIAAAGTDTMALRADVSRLADMNLAVKHVLEAYGRVDVLVNNAGITRDATLKNMTEERFDEVIAVNLKGRVQQRPRGAPGDARAGRRRHPERLLDRRALRQLRADQLRGRASSA